MAGVGGGASTVGAAGAARAIRTARTAVGTAGAGAASMTPGDGGTSTSRWQVVHVTGRPDQDSSALKCWPQLGQENLNSLMILRSVDNQIMTSGHIQAETEAETASKSLP